MPVKVVTPSTPPFSRSLPVFVYVSLVSLDQPPLPEEGRGVWEGGDTRTPWLWSAEAHPLGGLPARFPS